MPRFKRRSPEIIAYQLTNDPNDSAQLAQWCGAHLTPDSNPDGSDEMQFLILPTPEGPALVSPGDWVLQGPSCQFYLCKANVFDLLYEPIDYPPHDPARPQEDCR